MKQAILWASAGTGFTFFMTVLGASLVFLFKREMEKNIQKLLLGVAAGVMIAASMWSLLTPAIEEAEERGQIAWIPAAGGFAFGGLFLLCIDLLLPRLYRKEQTKEKEQTAFHRMILLVLAITLHNIPEGMVVGLAFALAAQKVPDISRYAVALTLAFGMGIQNFPEGASVALSLRKEGVSRRNAFFIAGLTGVAEPFFGVGITLIASQILSYMSWLLSFAAGAMIYVVSKELIPEANEGGYSNYGTVGIMIGFLIMMILDVALG